MADNRWQYLLFTICILPLSIIFIFFGCLDVYMKDFLYIGVALAVICVITFVVYLYKLFAARLLEKQLQEAILSTNIDQVDKLDPYEFEEWVARLLRIAGYNAKATKRSGDYGVDVLAEKEDEKIAIQVKKFTKPVGIKAVQEVISGMDYYGCYEGWVITTAPYFTKAAQNLAATRNIKLYNKSGLALFLYDLQKNSNIDLSVLESKNDN
ncbi:MAG: restriction endonuclease [Clostridia bacterium]|nr:restriction endonuclease [Clostridia bacterium]